MRDTPLARLAATLDIPLVVTKGVNVRYLTGLRSSNAALVVEPSGETLLLTDFRYAAAARVVEGVTFEQERHLVPALAARLAGRTVGIEADHVTVTAAEGLRTGGVDVVPTTGLVESLRATKEPGELDAIRAACALTDAVYGEVAEHGLVGRTEREIAWFIERRLHERGAQGLSFPMIVAAAENGARPHADPTDRRVPAGTLVTLDVGALVDGYCSDCTRTFATGALPDELARAYDLCAVAQAAALATVRPGVTGDAVDAVSRVPIAEAGLADAYGHGLGHGVGLEIHEAPTLRAGATDVLAVGNVVTIEPGLYLEGVGGVRIEDLVVVTATGCDVLTRFPKTLLTVS